MKWRLSLFIASLILLPPLAQALAGRDWQPPALIGGDVALPLMLSLAALVAVMLLVDTLLLQTGRTSLIRSQPLFLAANAAAGAVLGLLLAYLNLFSASWLSAAAEVWIALLYGALSGALLLPAVLVLRHWLAGYTTLLRFTMRAPHLPAITGEQLWQPILLLALFGLSGGAMWPAPLGALYWVAPLLLLMALQWLWHHPSLFGGLPNGDWSRPVLAAVAGLLVGALTLGSFQLAGGALYLQSPFPHCLPYFALFGLLSLQLSDVLAERWHGKKRAELFKKKRFPIPIVTRKD